MQRKIIQKLSRLILTTSIPMLASIAISNASEQINTQQQSVKAAAETSQFGRLVGRWKIQDYGLNAEGEWQQGNGADWNFYWILAGNAIQDDWIAPGMDKPAPENGRQYGTNIRIYNPQLKQWEMAWASNTGAKIDTFTASLEDQNMVMRGLFNGTDSKITFFEISDNHFSWKLEQQNTAEAWVEVYRIEAERFIN